MHAARTQSPSQPSTAAHHSVSGHGIQCVQEGHRLLLFLHWCQPSLQRWYPPSVLEGGVKTWLDVLRLYFRRQGSVSRSTATQPVRSAPLYRHKLLKSMPRRCDLAEPPRAAAAAARCGAPRGAPPPPLGLPHAATPCPPAAASGGPELRRRPRGCRRGAPWSPSPGPGQPQPPARPP